MSEGIHIFSRCNLHLKLGDCGPEISSVSC